MPSRPQSITADPIGSIISPIGFEDLEYVDGRGLQRKLCNLYDAHSYSKLVHQFTSLYQWEDVWRLQESRQALSAVSSTWMWKLSPAQCEIVPPNEFALVARIRVGAKVLSSPILCHRCGKRLDTHGKHALRCALTEATRGHDRVRDATLHLVHLADASACHELQGLVASRPLLRPADIYSESALPGGRAALDIGISTPGSCTAGNDCCDAMWCEKMKHYEAVLPEMRRSGLQYSPLIFSCFGRMHCETFSIISKIGMIVARKVGVVNGDSLVHRTLENIGVALVRRGVAMYRACLPRLSPEALNLMLGDGLGEE